MEDFILEIIKLFEVNFLLIALLIFFVGYFLLNKLWSLSNLFYLTSTNYVGEQRVHVGEVPRLGGLLIYFQLIFLNLTSQNFFPETSYNSYLLIILLPLMILCLKEDIFHNVDYQIRLFFLFISSIFLVIFFIPQLPVIDEIPYISFIFENTYINMFFFALCLMGLANGFNFIDGMNGLLGFYVVGVCMSCLSLSFVVMDYTAAVPLIMYLLCIICFLVVNYPLGKLFLGDSGAYLLGFLLGTWVIIFFGTHSNLSSWNAVLIFFYPSIEVIYSYFRKVRLNKSPFMPDRSHLHLKIFDIVFHSTKKPKLSNNLTTIFLAIFWLCPPVMIPWVHDNNLLILLALFLLTSAYICMNLFTPSVNNND